MKVIHGKWLEVKTVRLKEEADNVGHWTTIRGDGPSAVLRIREISSLDELAHCREEEPLCRIRMRNGCTYPVRGTYSAILDTLIVEAVDDLAF